MVCLEKYSVLKFSSQLICLPYCDHTVCGDDFVKLIESSDRRNFRLQMLHESGDSDNSDEYEDSTLLAYSYGTLSHTYFKCPICRMGHLIDNKLFDNIKTSIRVYNLEIESIEFETFRSKNVSLEKDLKEAYENFKKIEKENENLRTDAECLSKLYKSR